MAHRSLPPLPRRRSLPEIPVLQYEKVRANIVSLLIYAGFRCPIGKVDHQLLFINMIQGKELSTAELKYIQTANWMYFEHKDCPENLADLTLAPGLFRLFLPMVMGGSDIALEA